MNADRPLPKSSEAEKLVLGAMLVGIEGSIHVYDVLRSEDFSDTRNRKIFEAMSELRERGQVADLLGVHDVLSRDLALEDIGGIAYLAGLGDGIPRVSPVRQWASVVADTSRLRKIIHTVDALEERAFNREESAAKLLDTAIEQLSEMARDIDGESDDGSTYRDAGVALLNELRDDKRPHIFTGLTSLDQILGGLLPGELWIFAAATGVGKTVMAQQTRRRACRDGQHVMYASGEMKATHLQRRELAAKAEVSQGKMRHPDSISEAEFARLVDATAAQCNVCRILDGELDLLRIRRAARRMKAKSSLSLIVLDYDELIAVEGDTENDQQRNLARAAKSLGMELDCAVILVSQLRKPLAGEDVKRPTLQSIYGSGAKTKHSTGVLLVDRPYVRELLGDETDAQLFVLKNRDGRLGRLPCRFDVKKLEFMDPATEDHEPAPAPPPKLWDAKARATGDRE
jgi:replicative DNA helicase